MRDVAVTDEDEGDMEPSLSVAAQSLQETILINETTPASDHTENRELPPIDPLPEFGESDASAGIDETDDLTSLSLPEIESSSLGQDVITPASEAMLLKPRAPQTAPQASLLPGELTVALIPGTLEKTNGEKPPAQKPRPVATKKKSWMSWWQ